jgi:leucyl aminopeptidase (aminopeptidase T)
MDEVTKLSKVTVGDRLMSAARQAAITCLATTKDDCAVVIFDADRRSIAAALVQAFQEIGAKVEAVDMDSFGERPYTTTPGALIKAMERATVSALAVFSIQGELTVRRAVIDASKRYKIRHAHMPSITTEVFEDGLSMDYNEIARFMDKLVHEISHTSSLKLTSVGGSNIEFSYPSPPTIVKLDGLIKPGRWQNLPSGQIIIAPDDARGTLVVDSSLGDWFTNKYDVNEYPVTLEFENNRVRNLRCKNRKLERELSLYLRSSENSGRISELVIGANLGLTQGHSGSLFHGYRPGASISVGGANTPDLKLDWDAPTFVNLIGQHSTIYVGGRVIMTDDVFSEDLTRGDSPA